jgi:hypothetical protein
MSTTTPKLVSAEYLDGYRIRLRFADEACGVVDLERQLWGEVFEPLKRIARFREFRVDDEMNTIVWPNGADLAPEFLYAQVCSKSS